jgi:hypothetical protein
MPNVARFFSSRLASSRTRLTEPSDFEFTRKLLYGQEWLSGFLVDSLYRLRAQTSCIDPQAAHIRCHWVPRDDAATDEDISAPWNVVLGVEKRNGQSRIDGVLSARPESRRSVRYARSTASLIVCTCLFIGIFVWKQIRHGPATPIQLSSETRVRNDSLPHDPVQSGHADDKPLPRVQTFASNDAKDPSVPTDGMQRPSTASSRKTHHAPPARKGIRRRDPQDDYATDAFPTRVAKASTPRMTLAGLEREKVTGSDWAVHLTDRRLTDRPDQFSH